MTADEVIDEILRFVRDPSVSIDELRAAARRLIEQLEPEQRDAAIDRARALLAGQRLH